MSRQPGEPMRKLLALHNEWLVANGYPLHVPREKKTKLHNSRHRRATTYTRNCQNQKHRRRRKLQDASDLWQVSKSLDKEREARFCKKITFNNLFIRMRIINRNYSNYGTNKTKKCPK